MPFCKTPSPTSTPQFAHTTTFQKLAVQSLLSPEIFLIRGETLFCGPNTGGEPLHGDIIPSTPGVPARLARQ